MNTLPKFYETTRCSQCGYEKQWIDTNGCPEECGRGVAGKPQPRMTREVFEEFISMLDNCDDATSKYDSSHICTWGDAEAILHGYRGWRHACQRIWGEE